MKDFDIIVIGGGLAGLITAILTAGNGRRILVIEKKKYPFQKVCGEYVSNEVGRVLESIGFNPLEQGASRIRRLRMSSPTGRNYHSLLPIGGFGISRLRLDHSLMQIAERNGVEIRDGCTADSVNFNDDGFTVLTSSGQFTSTLVIGSYGKRDKLDQKLARSFIRQRTGYTGVKYHVRTDYPADEIGLDHFPGGYCGIVKIEDDLYNLCYMIRPRDGEALTSISDAEENILFTNPSIRKIFSEADFISRKPKAISEISFSPKETVYRHMLMCGDTAGLITPLCGNGMAMAIHGACILSSVINDYAGPGKIISAEVRLRIETDYEKKWRNAFASRLRRGRWLQRLAGRPLTTSLFLSMMHSHKSVAKKIISMTHGKVIEPADYSIRSSIASNFSSVNAPDVL